MNYKEQQQMRERMKEVERLVRMQEASNLEIKTLLETLAARVCAMETSAASRKNDDTIRYRKSARI